MNFFANSIMTTEAKFSPDRLKEYLPIVDALLGLLGTVPACKPYVDPIKAGLGLGRLIIPDASKNALAGLKETYQKLMSAREDLDDDEIRLLEIRLGVYIDVLTRNISE